MMQINKHIGSDFDDFLCEQGLLAEVEAVALKRVIAFQIQQEVARRRISRSGMVPTKIEKKHVG